MQTRTKEKQIKVRKSNKPTLVVIPEETGDTMENLKKQYRLKALLYHPDKNNSPDASAKFQEINESYQYLLDCLYPLSFLI